MKPNFYRLLIVPLAVLFACNPKPVGLEPFQPLDALLVLPLSVNMLTGTTAQLGAQRFKDGTGTDKTAAAAWRSNDTNVVTVSNPGGLLTAGSPGRTTVEGSVEGVKATVQVIVEAPSLQLLPVTLGLKYRAFRAKNPDGGAPMADIPRFTQTKRLFANLVLEDGGRVDVADQMFWGLDDSSVASIEVIKTTTEDGGVADGGVFFTSTGLGDAVITGIFEGQTVNGNLSVSREPDPM